MLDPIRDFAIVQVAGGHTATDTSIPLVAGHGARLPNPATEGVFTAIWWNITDFRNPVDDPNREWIRGNTNVNDIVGATRGVDGTPATPKNLAGKTYAMMITYSNRKEGQIRSRLVAGGVLNYTPATAGTATLNLANLELANRHTIQMPAGNITIAISNPTIGQIFTVEITQDGVGGRTVTWFAGIRWAGQTAPVLTTTANRRDSFVFIVTGVNTFDGFIGGQNI